MPIDTHPKRRGNTPEEIAVEQRQQAEALKAQKQQHSAVPAKVEARAPAPLVSPPAPIGMLAHTRNPNTVADVRDALAAAAALGRTLHVERVASLSELDAAVIALVQQRIAALFVAPQADFRIWQQQILALAERNALPTSFSNSDFVVAGGLMSYGPNQVESYREAGIYTGRILKGEKPAELPVLVSTKFNFAINLKTAKALGLTIPPTMLALTTMLVE
jgi:ABC-type uncharacterized transport system substrate-binding protein